MSKEIFTVTEDHLKLIKNFCVGWQDCDFGAPEIDPKHPFGTIQFASRLGRYSLDQLFKMLEYSTDGINWLPCGKLKQ